MSSRAYLKLYAFNEKDEMTDIKVIKISKEGEITMEEAIGQPAREDVHRDRLEEKKI